MRFLRAPRPPSMVPMAAMADLAFLLLLFLVVTTIHEVDRTTVDLPDSRARVEARKGAAVVVLHRDASGGLAYKFSDGAASSSAVTSTEDIYRAAAELVQLDPERQFVLRADGAVLFERIDEVLVELRRAGVRNVLLETRQRAPREAS